MLFSTGITVALLATDLTETRGRSRSILVFYFLAAASPQCCRPTAHPGGEGRTSAAGQGPLVSIWRGVANYSVPSAALFLRFLRVGVGMRVFSPYMSERNQPDSGGKCHPHFPPCQLGERGGVSSGTSGLLL